MEEEVIQKTLFQLNLEIKELIRRVKEKEKEIREIFSLLVTKFLDKHLTLKCNKYSCEENCQIKHTVPPKTIVILNEGIFVLSKERDRNVLCDIFRGILTVDDVKFLRGQNSIGQYVCVNIVTEYLEKKEFLCKMERNKLGPGTLTYTFLE